MGAAGRFVGSATEAERGKRRSGAWSAERRAELQARGAEHGPCGVVHPAKGSAPPMALNLAVKIPSVSRRKPEGGYQFRQPASY